MTGEFEIRLSNANCSRSLTLQVVVDDVHIVNAESFEVLKAEGRETIVLCSSWWQVERWSFPFLT